MIIRSWLVAAAAAFCGTAVLAEAGDPGLYLFKIPSSRGAADGVPPGDLVQADLHVRNPDLLVQRLAGTSISIVAVEETLVRIIADMHETLTGDPVPAHRAATFVVDFEEPPVADLVEALQSAHGLQPSIDELIDFVDSAIASKTYRRNFDLASQVANSREGDCTEHAVLLAALARATGRPARVALGIMFIESADSLFSFGHAWTEIHDGENWRIADATRPGLELTDARPRYVPLMSMVNEGPGYVMQLLDLTTLYPTRIDWTEISDSRAGLRP